jgi:ketosteroid isomerase-like protein
MSSTNLDLVRSIFARWDRGDYSSTEWADPQIEFVIPYGPDAIRTTGLAGMAAGWRYFLSTWDDGYRAEADQYRELDEERVLVTNTYHGRGKTSGLDVRQIGAKGATVLHIRAGKVARLVLYWDLEQALADLGLTPETAPADSPS